MRNKYMTQKQVLVFISLMIMMERSELKEER
jgi:hypothetical protein